MKEMDYYELLEISRTASDEVIKNAYRALAKKYHPDTSNFDSNYIEEKMRKINEAYEVLSSKEKRAAYDEELKLKELEKNEITTSNNNSNVNEYSLDDSDEEEERVLTKDELKRKNRKKLIITGSIVFILVFIITFIIASIFIEPSTFDKKNDNSKVETNSEEKTSKTNKSSSTDTTSTANTNKSNSTSNVKKYSDDDIVNKSKNENEKNIESTVNIYQ